MVSAVAALPASTIEKCGRGPAASITRSWRSISESRSLRRSCQGPGPSAGASASTVKIWSADCPSLSWTTSRTSCGPGFITCGGISIAKPDSSAFSVGERGLQVLAAYAVMGMPLRGAVHEQLYRGHALAGEGPAVHRHEAAHPVRRVAVRDRGGFEEETYLGLARGRGAGRRRGAHRLHDAALLARAAAHDEAHDPLAGAVASEGGAQPEPGVAGTRDVGEVVADIGPRAAQFGAAHRLAVQLDLDLADARRAGRPAYDRQVAVLGKLDRVAVEVDRRIGAGCGAAMVGMRAGERHAHLAQDAAQCRDPHQQLAHPLVRRRQVAAQPLLEQEAGHVRIRVVGQRVRHVSARHARLREAPNRGRPPRPSPPRSARS